MKTIWKYKLAPRTELEMPAGAVVLTVGAQGEDVVIWALINSDAQNTEKRTFVDMGTGHHAPEGTMQFIGTVQVDSGLVFHIFELLIGCV
jgi:hypothetical protein